MKTYALFTMLFLLVIEITSGEIINGYKREIESARTSLRNLEALRQDRNVKRRIELARQFIVYYELTEKLLAQFKSIAPSLYTEIDTLKDYKGRFADVYVKFVPKSEIQSGALATTNLEQLATDEHAYFSHYGAFTVSIKIIIAKHSLSILAHEFGHVRYQVPNLASYVDFFLGNYQDYQARAQYLGHKPNDPSGQSAVAFEHQFRRELTKYIQETNNNKFPNALAILEQIAVAVKLDAVMVYANSSLR